MDVADNETETLAEHISHLLLALVEKKPKEIQNHLLEISRILDDNNHNIDWDLIL